MARVTQHSRASAHGGCGKLRIARRYALLALLAAFAMLAFAFATIAMPASAIANGSTAVSGNLEPTTLSSTSAKKVQAVQTPRIAYRAHYADIGWEAWTANGDLSGVLPEKESIDSVAMKLIGTEGGVKYRVKNVGGSWQKWTENGAKAGGKKTFEALSIRLTGAVAKTHNVYYRVRVKGTGWQAWRMNGQVAGMLAKGSRITGIEVVVAAKSAEVFRARTGLVRVYNISANSELDLGTVVESDDMKIVNVKSDLVLPGSIHPGNNTTINAVGKTIVVADNGSGCIVTYPRKTNYKSLTNLTVNGGTWRNEELSDVGQSMFRISHASNIELINLTIEDGYINHAVELIACKNVYVYKVNLLAQGNCPSDCTDVQLQIDLADQYAAPNIGSEYWDGAPSKNVFIYGCTVKGARGIGSNYASSNPDNCMPENYHSNITIKKCTIEGKTGEAVTIYNTVSATIANNDITSWAPMSRDSYTVGVHVAYFDGMGPTPKKSNKIIIKNNVVRGGRQAVLVFTHNGSRFGTVTITGNTLYAKKGKKATIYTEDWMSLKKTIKNNTKYKWRP